MPVPAAPICRSPASLTVRSAAALLLIGFLGACTTGVGTQASLTTGIYAPVVTPVNDLNRDLRSMPSPKTRVSVAVYDFPDLTGQYKDMENFQSLSRAVSQGGAPMLIKALQDAGEGHWFTVFDRAALNDLLKERQIVTEMRKTYRGEENIDPGVLPPLDYAGVVLEGGIIGYDTNTLTGGAGASFLGIGAHTKWTQDTITVTLRAVSAKTSEVLATVTVSKAIASVALDGNVFRYIQMDRLLQAEAGITHNEPKQVAVQAAVDKAVMSLILEGARMKVWSFKDPAAGATLLEAYLHEKYGTGGVDDGALNPALPVTRNATAVVQTKPLPRPEPAQATVQSYSAQPGSEPWKVGNGPPPPPEAAGGEVLN